jgi:16S rRNA (guanine(527)-N(7))-methyltransferase RsmG
MKARDELIEALLENKAAYCVDLRTEHINDLADFYDLVLEHNPILHLVAPCSPAEFATRHILESLTLLEFLPVDARFADVGSGAGFPSIPCLIAREDLSATLVESKEKKTKFLEQTVRKLGISAQTRVINRQFEEVEPTGFDYVTCRALDKFTERLPRLIRWASGKQLLLFGGNSMLNALNELKIPFDQKLMPLSRQRFVIVTRDRV